MSFKQLNDPQRQRALVPFLQAADDLNGHLVAVLVDKKMANLTTGKTTLTQWAASLKLSGKWNAGAFESMARKAHFFALCASQWSPPGANISWITDQDEFVANESRLDDAQRFAARLLTLYTEDRVPIIIAMNSTAVDEDDLEFEDFVAIPDLAAGMLAEICSRLSSSKDWSKLDKPYVLEDVISDKSELLSDWFWFPHSRLRRTCIVIDKIGSGGRVMKLNSIA